MATMPKDLGKAAPRPLDPVTSGSGRNSQNGGGSKSDDDDDRSEGE